MTRVIELQAQNFKRLKAVSIHPDGHTVVISGRNSQGKSSVLDAIWAALGGAKAAPDEPVRRGAKKAEIRVELDEIVVVRKFIRGGGTRLEVTAKDGSTVRSPQAVLDKLVGSLTFDPLAFSRQKPQAQAETLRELSGVDVKDVDLDLEIKLDARRDANKEVKRLEALRDAHPLQKDVPDAEVKVSDLLAELERRQRHNRRIEEIEAHEQEIRRRCEVRSEQIERWKEEIRALHARIDEAVLENNDDSKNVVRCEQKLLKMVPANEYEVSGQIENAEETNEAIRKNIRAKTIRKELQAMESAAEGLQDEVENLRALRQAKIEAAKFPVEGLGLGDDGVTFGGIPFSQASQAEQLRVSTAIGLAMNPELRVLLIRDGSLLDRESLVALAKMAEDNDAQVWIERVSDGEDVGIVIEDGEVVE